MKSNDIKPITSELFWCDFREIMGSGYLIINQMAAVADVTVKLEIVAAAMPLKTMIASTAAVKIKCRFILAALIHL
jgi:hypothetical protein